VGSREENSRKKFRKITVNSQPLVYNPE